MIESGYVEKCLEAARVACENTVIRRDGFIEEAQALIEHGQAEVGIGGAAVETGRRKILLTGLRKIPTGSAIMPKLKCTA